MIHTVVHIISTPAHCGHLPSDKAARTEAPEMLLIAFQPVVETMENTTTRRLPQYPNEYRLCELVWDAYIFSSTFQTYEKVVIRNPVKPKDAVQAGSKQETTLTTRNMAKQSQKLRPMLPPTIPVDNVATAMFALSLEKSEDAI